MRIKRLSAVGAVVAVLGTAAFASPANSAGTPKNSFFDDFHGNLNPHWTVQDGGRDYVWEACYRPDQVFTDHGILVLEAIEQDDQCANDVDRWRTDHVEQFQSGAVHTTFRTERFGTIQTRVKLPQGQGLWPAIWLTHEAGGRIAELDLAELFHTEQPGLSRSTLHLDGAKRATGTGALEAPGSDAAWHELSMSILPTDDGYVRFEVLLDGVTVIDHTEIDNLAWHLEHLDTEHATWDIRFNLAVGGEWAAHPYDTLGVSRKYFKGDRCGLKPNYAPTDFVDGCPTVSADGVAMVRSVFPAQVQVDWVRFTPFRDS